jgi:hypothetical protein
MLTSNQQQALQMWPFLAEQPLTFVDWLPWNHTFGGNHNFTMVLRHAGTLVDRRRPPAAPRWSARPCATSPKSRRRSISTCRPATRRCCRISSAMRLSRNPSSRSCG